MSEDKDLSKTHKPDQNKKENTLSDVAAEKGGTTSQKKENRENLDTQDHDFVYKEDKDIRYLFTIMSKLWSYALVISFFLLPAFLFERTYTFIQMIDGLGGVSMQSSKAYAAVVIPFMLVFSKYISIRNKAERLDIKENGVNRFINSIPNQYLILIFSSLGFFVFYMTDYLYPEQGIPFMILISVYSGLYIALAFVFKERIGNIIPNIFFALGCHTYVFLYGVNLI